MQVDQMKYENCGGKYELKIYNELPETRDPFVLCVYFNQVCANKCIFTKTRCFVVYLLGVSV